jgi:NADPH:quinone reductase-like Zn-dependent oxidoreductase
MRTYQLPKTEGIEDLTRAETEAATPRTGQVLVRMRAASLNYRDLMIVAGQYPRANIEPHRVPLSDGAGEVVELGPGVSRFKQGDRVAGIFHQNWIAGDVSDDRLGSSLGGDVDGVLTEYRVFDEAGLVGLPEHLSYEEGATLPCAAVTAWNALFEHRPVQPGETVLTLGTGGVSIFALQLAKAAGAWVIATSSSDEKLDRVRSLGASELINYKQTPEWDQQVRALTGKRGVGHVVEVGGAGTLPRSLRAARRGGQVNVIGVLAGGGEIDPMNVLGRSVVMRGIFVGSREMFERMNRAIAVHELRPVVDRVFSFEEAAEAYRYVQSGAHLGKVVIKIA